MGNHKGQSRETGSIGYTRRGKTKQKHNTICVGHQYAQANTNNVNRTVALLTNNWRQRRTESSLFTLKYIEHAFRITFIRYVHSRQIGKRNNFKVLEASTPMQYTTFLFWSLFVVSMCCIYVRIAISR